MTGSEPPERAVLIVEHDEGVRALLARLVSKWGFTPLLAESEARGVRLLEERSEIALVLSDFQPGADGETVHEHLGRRRSSRPAVLCTLPTARGVFEDVEHVPRPFDMEVLRGLFERHVAGVDRSSGDAEGGPTTG